MRAVFHGRRSPSQNPACGRRITAALKAKLICVASPSSDATVLRENSPDHVLDDLSEVLDLCGVFVEDGLGYLRDRCFTTVLEQLYQHHRLVDLRYTHVFADEFLKLVERAHEKFSAVFSARQFTLVYGLSRCMARAFLPLSF